MTLQPHLLVERVPANVVITGDPKRVKLFAGLLSDVEQLASNREYEIISGTYAGSEICVCSTGIGAPSTAIAVEELANAGARRIVRLGTCGAMRRGIALGDLIIPTGAIRDEGTSHRYVDPGFPATPCHTRVQSLMDACPPDHTRYLGIVWTTDKFYLDDTELAPWFDTTLAVEMECSALFVLARLRGISSAALLVVDGNLPEGKMKENMERPDEFDAAMMAAVRVVLEALSKE